MNNDLKTTWQKVLTKAKGYSEDEEAALVRLGNECQIAGTTTVLETKDSEILPQGVTVVVDDDGYKVYVDGRHKLTVTQMGQGEQEFEWHQ